jgi:hypothetical protein
MKLEGEQTLMRVFIGESDRWKSQPLHEALVEMLRREGFAGATVIKGIMGFGCHSVTHTDKLLRFSADLPVIVEVVDTLEKIKAIMPRIDDMMSGGMVTLENVHVIRYRKNENFCS